VPDRPDWLHEVKYDGYRLRVERDGVRVRLITRGGYDWTKRYPWIVEAALKNRQKRFVIDGEAVILGVDGVSDFNALHSGRHNEEVQLCAFDILVEGGDDFRKLPLHLRKTSLNGCWHAGQMASSIRSNVARSVPIYFGQHVGWGWKGSVSKRRDWPYQAGRSKHWVKVKNRQHPTISRVMEALG
jgi:bifunctional non-homologous end joining protein LigD